MCAHFNSIDPLHADPNCLGKKKKIVDCKELLTLPSQVLRDAKIDLKDINEVVMVGGSTRIPGVQALVQRLVGRTPNLTVNPDEVVALGAAVQAGASRG